MVLTSDVSDADIIILISSSLLPNIERTKLVCGCRRLEQSGDEWGTIDDPETISF
jgi:hypothetical protein